jgi:hypothetical protein
MVHLRKVLITICLFGYGIKMQAQETTTVSGGNVNSNDSSVSYTVRQVAYTVNSGTIGTVTQNVQQPYEISVVSGIEEAKGVNLMCSVFPNPNTDFLTLKVENYDIENLYYELYNVKGSILENKKIEANETIINMNGLVPSAYFLKGIQNNKEVKTFKIVKN